MKNTYKEISSKRGLFSSLPLQVALYFNIFYFPFWLVSVAVMLNLKYSSLDYLYRIILISVLVAIVIIEAARLYLGYVGNLTEKVPELAGFWLLTFLLQLPLLGFLLFNEATIILPLERTVNIILIIFLLVELAAGFQAVKVMTQEQATQFHLRHFEEWAPSALPFSPDENEAMQQLIHSNTR